MGYGKRCKNTTKDILLRKRVQNDVKCSSSMSHEFQTSISTSGKLKYNDANTSTQRRMHNLQRNINLSSISRAIDFIEGIQCKQTRNGNWQKMQEHEEKIYVNEEERITLENPRSSSYTHNDQVEDDIHDIHNLEVEMEDELRATQDVTPDQVVIDEERNMYESLVAACYLRISDPADYIVAHGSVFPRALGDMVHGVPLVPHQVKVSVTVVLPGMGEYTIPCPTEHIENVADCEGSFVAWPKSLVGFRDRSLHTARHGDFSSNKSRPILGVRPTAPPSSPIQDVVDRSSYVSFGPRCRELCQWLTRTSDLPTISVILDPESMLYPEETELRMRPENIRLGGYFGNDTCLSLRLDRIGLMFPEYPNK
ncbi:unnamed protein product [Cuscuta campestris]|uniref:DUF8039 domain-containing protein n=1 Tax=Cuscuta campestris TaxID=132261 RepID=A0A484KJY2_9ASTE|nr:unnamed protein product [Cuscuta campestris]